MLAIEELSEVKNINQATILDILRMSLKVKSDPYGFSKYAMLTMNLLYLSHSEYLIECFMSKDMSKDIVLINNTNGDISIFGKLYSKNTRESLITS